MHSPASPFTATVSTFDLLYSVNVMDVMDSCGRGLLTRTSFMVVLDEYYSRSMMTKYFVHTICLVGVP